LFVAILALFIIKTRYKLVHYVAMMISVAGTIMVILEDFNDKKGMQYKESA